MSVVTSVIILASLLDDLVALGQINAFFAQERAARQDRVRGNMTLVNNSSGGWSAMQESAFAGAWNHLDDLAFLRHLRDNVRWDDRRLVRVFINREHDDGWLEVALFSAVEPPAAITLDSMVLDYDEDAP